MTPPPPPPPPTMLKANDFALASAKLECSEAFLHAVVDVETAGSTGFLSDGRVEILFESHTFHELTGGKFDTVSPNISTPSWEHNYGAAGSHQWDRLQQAISLAGTELAYQAASWGMFQQMGRGHLTAGFPTARDMVEAYSLSQQAHLFGFENFVMNNLLVEYMQKLDFTGFALGYNGAAEKENDYDEKLSSAYTKWVGILGTSA